MTESIAPTTFFHEIDRNRRDSWLLVGAVIVVLGVTSIALAHINKNEKDPKRAYEDIVWALINTKEFLFNH